MRWEGPQPRNELLDNTAYDIYAKPFADLRRDEQQYVDKILSSSPVQDYKTVYSRPVGQEKENFFTVVPEEGPGGKTIYKIINSDISQAKGQTLSSVIGGDLAKRVIAEESGDVPMKGYVMGSEGYTQTYERKAPSIYKRLLKSLDPEAKVESGPLPHNPELRAEVDRIAQQNFARDWNELTPEDQDRIRYMLGDSAASLEPVHGTYIQITPKMRQEYERLKQKFGAVFPAYKSGGAVSRKAKTNRAGVEHALKNSRNYAR